MQRTQLRISTGRLNQLRWDFAIFMTSSAIRANNPNSIAKRKTAMSRCRAQQDWISVQHYLALGISCTSTVLRRHRLKQCRSRRCVRRDRHTLVSAAVSASRRSMTCGPVASALPAGLKPRSKMVLAASSSSTVSGSVLQPLLAALAASAHRMPVVGF